GGLVAYIQQAIVLREDEEEMEALADAKPSKDVDRIPEAVLVENPKPKTKTSSKSAKNSKRRKR
ncbi:MAG TPA: hypothetical protein VFH39_04620, partial [Candidatus Saccharimonadales bacterium]|nr:hypothetical protein [Candidatus Saccharimonadales bacterium]